MKALLNRIHARVGDLWWYSAMIFLACRSGDAIQAFIGLWLVPKYVGPQELGAVLPLQQLTSFLTVPLAIVAVVFSKYVNTYATRGEYGKVKSFIHDVFTCSFVLFIVCIAGAYLIMPFFYERLKIASGSLTFLILLCGLFTNIGAIVGAAQQGLKRFKTMSVMTLLGAPIRLVTLLIAMPIRALSGYILGQTTPVATTSILSIFDIRKALKPYTPDTSWRKDWKAILNYMWPIALYTSFGLAFATISTTVYRQRLPEIESAANYMLSRFAEIAGYFGASISIILFPLVAETHEKGHEDTRLLKRAIIGTIIPTCILALAFVFLSDWIFSLTDTWATYRPYAYLLPLLTITTGLGSIIGATISYEMACRRFGIAAFITIFNLIWTCFLVSFTGYEFFNGILPDMYVNFMRDCNLASIRTLTYVSLSSAIIQLLFIRLIHHRRHALSAQNR